MKREHEFHDLPPFSLPDAITIREAAALMRGRAGPLTIPVARRFANPRRGCRPLGPDGPILVLPCVRIGADLLTMPSWVRAFEDARVRYGIRTPAPAIRSDSERTRADLAAQASLRRMGVKC